MSTPVVTVSRPWIPNEPIPPYLGSSIASNACCCAGESYLPILATDFLDLYKILNFNLRSVLQEADKYCLSVSQGDHPDPDAEKTTRYRQWLQEEGRRIHDAVARQLTPRAWKVCENAIKIGGSFSPSDFETFGFNSIAAFRLSVKSLEDVHLVTSVRDETDSRRKSIVITPKAFLVYHYRINLSKSGQ